jgi:hypothetical protein
MNDISDCHEQSLDWWAGRAGTLRPNRSPIRAFFLYSPSVRLYALGPYENQGQTPCEYTQVNARGRVPDGGIQIVRAGSPLVSPPLAESAKGGLGGFAGDLLLRLNLN